MANDEFAEFAELRRCRKTVKSRGQKWDGLMPANKDLSGIVRYAKVHCEDRCPAERDPETCLALIEMCSAAGEDPPLCYEDTKGFSKAYFVGKIREVEKRHGKPVREVLAEYDSRGVKTLEENVERLEAEFALKAVRALDQRVAKG
jgi:hypothetical protein